MTKVYGTATNANIEKDIIVTAAKFKIQVTIDIWMAGGGSHECFISVWNSAGAIILMNQIPQEGGPGSSPFGNFVEFNDGTNHRQFTLVRQDGINYTIGEVLTIRFNTTPWATANPMYFYDLKFELVD